MTGGKRSVARLRAIAGMIAVTGAILPVSAAAQTTTDVNDLIGKLQNQIGSMQKQYQAEIRNLQKQHQAQIQNLQKQLNDLKAAQAAPRTAPPPAAAAGLTMPPSGAPLPKTPGFSIFRAVDGTAGLSGAEPDPGESGHRGRRDPRKRRRLQQPLSRQPRPVRGDPCSSSAHHHQRHWDRRQQPGSMSSNPQPAGSV